MEYSHNTWTEEEAAALDKLVEAENQLIKLGLYVHRCVASYNRVVAIGHLERRKAAFSTRVSSPEFVDPKLHPTGSDQVLQAQDMVTQDHAFADAVRELAHTWSEAVH